MKPGIVIIVIIIGIYVVGYIFFLPTIVARRRRHNNVRAIFVMNLLLGLTFIGWAGALIWANTNDVRPLRPTGLTKPEY
jgi:threonine/homoserine/homoserine lactone efflux protein